jgi:hypothetical protein
MGPQVVAQQGNLTFGQFVWGWIGGMCFLGVLFIIGGWTFSRSKTAGKTQVRQTLLGLIRSGTLREEDVTPALEAPHLPPAPEEMSGQMWLERILAGAPEIEQLIRFWKRPLHHLPPNVSRTDYGCSRVMVISNSASCGV